MQIWLSQFVNFVLSSFFDYGSFYVVRGYLSEILRAVKNLRSLAGKYLNLSQKPHLFWLKHQIANMLLIFFFSLFLMFLFYSWHRFPIAHTHANVSDSDSDLHTNSDTDLAARLGVGRLRRSRRDVYSATNRISLGTAATCDA